MGRFSTGMMIGGLIGMSSVALMNLDKKNMRKVQRQGKKIMNKAEDLMDDIRNFM